MGLALVGTFLKNKYMCKVLGNAGGRDIRRYGTQILFFMSLTLNSSNVIDSLKYSVMPVTWRKPLRLSQSEGASGKMDFDGPGP